MANSSETGRARESAGPAAARPAGPGAAAAEGSRTGTGTGSGTGTGTGSGLDSGPRRPRREGEYSGGYSGRSGGYEHSYGEDDEVGGERRRYAQISDRSRCRFCREKVARVDYKDVLTLQKLCTSQGRIFSRKRSGNCAAHQRMVKRAIKQARFIGLVSYTT